MLCWVPGQIQASIYPALTTLALFRRVSDIRAEAFTITVPQPPPQAGFTDIRAVLYPAVGDAAVRPRRDSDKGRGGFLIYKTHRQADLCSQSSVFHSE